MPHASGPRRGWLLAATALCAGALALTVTTATASAGGVAHMARTPSAMLQTIAFFNLDDGYGAFTAGTTTCSSRIGSTDDGGARFTALATVDRWPCGQVAPARALAFDDHGDGFFYGPRLFVTHDGGASWAPDPQHGSVLSVEALGLSIWMLETARQPPPSTARTHSMGLRLLESIDGGRRWHVVALPAAAVIQPRDDDLAFTGWLTRVSLTSAYVAADAPFHGGRQLDVTPLWLTTDAGATWLARTIPCRSIDGSLIMSVAPQGAAFDVCASEPGAGSQLKAVLESTDAGRHWTFRSQCRFDPYLTCNPTSQTPGYVSQIDAVSPTTIFQVGGRADPSVSHDAGRTWRNVSAVGTASGGGTAQVAFFNTDDGVVLGEEYRAPGFISELWETTDAGAHWAPRIPVAS